MAGYGYSNRSHNRYDGFDPRRDERSHGSEQPCFPALDEYEGRRMIAVDPYQNPGSYVMKIETTVERVHPFTFSELYRQCPPPRYEHRPSDGVVHNKLHGPLIPSSNRPPVVEEFFNNIQNEASQPSRSGAPRATLRIPVYPGTGNAGDSDHEKEWNKPITKTIKDEDLEADKILKPPVTPGGGNGPRYGHPPESVPPCHYPLAERERTYRPPSMVKTGRRERDGSHMDLSKPMNDIGTAIEYLERVANPSSDDTVKDEAPNHGYFKGDKILKPPVAVEGGPAARPGHRTGPMQPNHPISSERGEWTTQPPSMITTGGWERQVHNIGLDPTNERGKTKEHSRDAGKPVSVSMVPKRDSVPQTIDSKEARRRYENVNPSPEPYAAGYPCINSQEAARRYNGEFVGK